MSLDLYLRKTPCETCGNQPENFNINYTYNASPMWYKIYPDDKGMVQIDGMTGEEARNKLIYARDYMESNKAIMLELQPSNGWGSYEGFLEFIDKCIGACLEHPKLIWEAWR